MEQSTFSAAMIAVEPAEEHRDALMLYGQFVGDWITETTEWFPDGTRRTETWDVRFQWVLEGRAIQDLWITPPRSAGAAALSSDGNRYSTTLRVYDASIDAWHIVWTNPRTGAVIRQLGRRVGHEIVQMAPIGDDGTMTRWVYRDITPASFRWCNERSVDLGATWKLTQEMRAVRVAPSG